MIDQSLREIGGMEAHQLKQQVQAGKFSGMRQSLARTRQARDWQDRFFLLNLIAPHVQANALRAASAAEPDAADLRLLLGAYSCDMVGKSRGTQDAEQTSDKQFSSAHQQIQAMMEYLLGVYALDPEDPTPHVFAMRGLVVFSPNEDTIKQEYATAVRLSPDCVPAHYYMINARSLKWGGTHAEALSVARAAMKASTPGSDLPVCIFLAHFLVWQYARVFDKNKAEADRYLSDQSVNQELNQALDAWTANDYRGRRSSVPYFHQAALWYYLSGDNVRLRRVLALTAGVPCDHLWAQLGAAGKTYAAAFQKAAAPQEKKSGFLGWFKR